MSTEILTIWKDKNKSIKVTACPWEPDIAY